MKNQLHTILGANGGVGQAVYRELVLENSTYRLVSRNPKQRQKDFFKANLLDKDETEKAVAGSTFVYLCIGLPYRTVVWQTQWEKVMKNVIEACAKHHAKLIYLDNIYMYAAPLPVPFDEKTLQKPISKKGQARKRTTDLMLTAMKTGKIKGVIGRSADFVGAGAVNSSFYIAFLERMLVGKHPQTLTSGDIKHTYANVLDNGRALVALAQCEECYGQVWHLPVGKPITTNEMLVLFNRVLGSDYKLRVLPRMLRKLLTIFVRPLKEVEEMLYQFESEYIMSFDKFKRKFPDFKVATNEESVLQMVEWFKEKDNLNANL